MKSYDENIIRLPVGYEREVDGTDDESCGIKEEINASIEDLILLRQELNSINIPYHRISSKPKPIEVHCHNYSSKTPSEIKIDTNQAFSEHEEIANPFAACFVTQSGKKRQRSGLACEVDGTYETYQARICAVEIQLVF